MKRRGNGEGTIRQRPDGRWEARFSIQGDGRTTLRSVYGKTRKEVQTKMRAAELSAARGLAASDTLGAHVADWLTEVKERRETNTYRMYSGLMKNHILPELGAIKLDKLTPTRIRRWLAKLQQGTLSPGTLATIRTVLVIALEHAVRYELLERNPARLVSAPSVPKREYTTLTPDEARSLILAIRGHRFEAAYLLALLLGLRRGEIFGLSWSDIDLDAKTLRVSQQLQREPKIGPVLKRTKTVGSVRTLPIPANLVPVLAARKEWERLDRAVAGSTWKGAWDGERLLFRSRMGGPAIPDTALKQFRQLLDGLGLPAQRLHDLRHNCASLLFAQGIPARLVMELLGHSNIGITMNIYTHPQLHMAREATQGLENYLSVPDPQPNGDR